MSSEQQSSEVPAPSDVIMKQEAPQQPQDKAQDAQQAQDLPSKVNEQSTTAGPDGKVQKVANKDPYALVWAAAKGELSKVQRLVEGGFPVDAPDADGSSPMVAAAWTNHKATVEYLLSKGADINSRNHWHGWTALHASAAKGHEEVVKLLLEKGADPTIADKHGQKPSMYAAFHDHQSIAKILEDKEKELADKSRQEQEAKEAEERAAADAKALQEKAAKNDGRVCADGCVIM